jgi:putative oxidoreductase
MRYGIVALRAVVGALFIGHGLQKLAGWFGGHGLEGTAAGFEKMGMTPGRRNALAAGLSETAGGLSLVTGFLTPLGTSAVTGTMAVAIAKVHGSKGLWNTGGGYEYNLVLGAAAFAIAAEGPGSLSLDARLGTEWSGPGVAAAQLAAGLLGAAAVMQAGARADSDESSAPPAAANGDRAGSAPQAAATATTS